MVVALVLLALASACSRSAALPARALRRRHPGAWSAAMMLDRVHRMTSKTLAIVDKDSKRQGPV